MLTTPAESWCPFKTKKPKKVFPGLRCRIDHPPSDIKGFGRWTPVHFLFATAGRHASSLPRRGLLRVGVHAAGLLALWFTRRLLAATFAGCAAATIGHRTFATAARNARIRTFCGGSGARLGPSTHQGWSAPPNNRRWPVTFGLHLAIHHAHSAAGSYRGAALYTDTRGARCGYQLWHGAVRL